MFCSYCETINDEDAHFCKCCGSPFAKESGIKEWYGVFYPGGYGDGYYCNFRFEATIEEALEWQNSPAVLSINQIQRDTFLGKVEEMELVKEDINKPISSRWKVLEWYRLLWNGKQWELGLKEKGPDSIGLSNLE